MTAANLQGFLPIVGDALVQGQEEIQTSAIKLLSTIMKVDLPELEQNAPVYVKETVA
jgi:U3 small nucleolar RNA-associated protein 20